MRIVLHDLGEQMLNVTRILFVVDIAIRLCKGYYVYKSEGTDHHEQI